MRSAWTRDTRFHSASSSSSTQVDEPNPLLTTSSVIVQTPYHIMLIHSLPLEVCRYIIEQACLDHEDLCSLALTSSLLRDEAQRVLFNNPGKLNIGHESWHGDKFLDSIISSPKRLALMVRTYSQQVNWDKPIRARRTRGFSLRWELRHRKKRLGRHENISSLERCNRR